MTTGHRFFVRNSYVSTLCPVVLCPDLCASERLVVLELLLGDHEVAAVRADLGLQLLDVDLELLHGDVVRVDLRVQVLDGGLAVLLRLAPLGVQAVLLVAELHEELVQGADDALGVELVARVAGVDAGLGKEEFARLARD